MLGLSLLSKVNRLDLYIASHQCAPHQGSHSLNFLTFFFRSSICFLAPALSYQHLNIFQYLLSCKHASNRSQYESCSFLSLQFLLKSHFISEAFPDHPIENCTTSPYFLSPFPTLFFSIVLMSISCFTYLFSLFFYSK